MNQFMTLESINRFTNDSVISDLASIVKKFREMTNKGLFRNELDNINKMYEVKENFSIMGDILFKRFGIHYKLMMDHVEAAINLNPHSELGGTTSGDKAYFELLEKYFEHLKDDDPNWDFDVANDDLYIAIYQNTVAIRKDLSSGREIAVDENKAKIIGLSDRYAGVIKLNFPMLFSMKLTDMEIVAIIMHEVGHGFNSFATMYTSRNSVLSTMEAIQDVKNKPKKIISLVKDTYGSKITDEASAIDALVSDIAFADTTGYVITNNEAAADQFIARFGLSVELSTGLAKLYGVNIPKSVKEHSSDRRVRALAVIIAMQKGMGRKKASKMVPLLSMLALDIRSSILDSQIQDSSSKIVSEYISDEFTYDHIVQRITRLKHDVVRQLRTISMNSTQKEYLINEIKDLDAMIHNYERDYKISEFSKTLSAMFTRGKHHEIREFYAYIESLTENDLHYQKERFKLLKGKIR